MAHLVDRVRQVESLEAEEVRVNKGKKERVDFVNIKQNDLTSDVEYNHVEEIEVDVAEIKLDPSYVCKLLTSINGKNNKFPKKTYTFDMAICDEVFDLLVADGQVLVPQGGKVPPLEQRKKRGFCKYNNFLGHKTSQCFIFKDLVQTTLNEGGLKFSKGRAPMKIDSDPLQVRDASYVEPITINMVEITEDFDMGGFQSERFKSDVVSSM
ncbi:uncharacterized protein LOC127096187 [Lathyrus oleraceus]|uniref:uncharacterized protein LOC127096187 n=1 Tax=Pisum sativum TaxID=3888 RepID=UPI0021CFAA34|nr:uncharacterized protein LOC127096187 [Pisum sativum]